MPTSTKIVPGEPATANANAGADVYKGPEASHVYQDMRKDYAIISTDPQFGGAMTWDVNNDSLEGYPFAKAMKGL